MVRVIALLLVAAVLLWNAHVCLVQFPADPLELRLHQHFKLVSKALPARSGELCNHKHEVV